MDLQLNHEGICLVDSAEISLLRTHQHSVRNKDTCDLFHWDVLVFAFKKCQCWYTEFSVKSLSQIPTARTFSRHCGQGLHGGCPDMGNPLHKQWKVAREGRELKARTELQGTVGGKILHRMYR